MVLFCCAVDWWALSRETRAELWRTAKLPVIAPRRRAAIEAAAAEWAVLDGR